MPKNGVIRRILKPQVNRKFNKSKKAKPGACQKQIKTKMAAVNKKLKFVILQQVNVISILLLQIIAASEYYQHSRFLHITFKFLQIFYKIDKFVIGPFKTCLNEVTIFIFKK